MLILLVRLGVEFGKYFWQWEVLYTLLIGLGILFLISLCDELNDRFKRIPFGPLRLPLYGNRPQLWIYGGKRPYAGITRLAKWYRGGFMKIYLGLTGYVSVNGTKKLTQVLLAEEEWAGERDEVWRLDRTETEKKSPTDLQVWVSRRNIAIRCLQNIILDKKDGLNNLISKQVGDLLKAIEGQERVDKFGNRDISAETFLPYVVATVWCVLTGDFGIEVGDKRVQTIHRCLLEWEEKSVGLRDWADYYPFLVRWIPSWAGFSKLEEVNHDFRKVLKALIKEQYGKAAKAKETLEISYVQACVREFKELRKNSFGTSQMNDSSSIALLFEFLCPGPLMISSHIGFCLMFAARDSIAQDRIFEEIRLTFGSKEPTFDKMEQMPYTCAFILEVYRISSIIPFERRKLLKLIIQEDTRFPKEMPILLNYHSANMDSKVWDEPTVFRPDRFLTPTEDRVINQEKLISLAAEKHLCAGQPLLRMILFAFLTGTLQKWRLELWPNFVDKGPQYTILNKPQPFRVKMKPRSSPQ